MTPALVIDWAGAIMTAACAVAMVGLVGWLLKELFTDTP